MMALLRSWLTRWLWLTCCAVTLPVFAQEAAESARPSEQASAQGEQSGAEPTTAPSKQHAASSSQPAAQSPRPAAQSSPATLQDRQSERPSGFTGTNPMTVVFGLILILLLIYGCAWLMKRLGAVNLGGVAGMKIVAGVSVGPREKVLLLEVGQQQVLVGVAPGRVSHLESFEQPVIQPPEGGPGDFSRRLQRFMGAGANDRGNRGDA